jgi:phage terminase Nu1 subunit (DNA packaging protein)
MSSQTYPTAVIAKLFNLTPQWVNKLAAQGIIPKAGDNKFDLAPTVRAYITYLQEETNQDNDKLTSDARIAKLRADKLARELAQIDSELISTDEAMKAWGIVCGNIRARLLSIPTKAASLVIGLKTLPEIKGVLQKLIYEALTELANPDLKQLSSQLQAEDRARKKKHTKA